MLLLLASGCLFDSDNSLFSDLDGDGFSVADGDCVDDRPLVQGPIILGNDEFDTLQLAIDSAEAGDTVIVCPGTYPAITVGSSITIEGRPEGGDVIIDAGGDGSAVTIDGSATLIGLTIQGGQGNKYQGDRWGGGVDGVGAEFLEMRDCLVADNAADNAGGLAGPQQQGSTTILDNVRFRDNYAQFFGGGALLFDDVDATRLVANRNTTDGVGGGIIFVETNAVVDQAVFLENDAEDYGGGMVVVNGKVSFTGAEFTSNTPDDIGLDKANGHDSTMTAPSGGSFTCDSTVNDPGCG